MIRVFYTCPTPTCSHNDRTVTLARIQYQVEYKVEDMTQIQETRERERTDFLNETELFMLIHLNIHYQLECTAAAGSNYLDSPLCKLFARL